MHSGSMDKWFDAACQPFDPARRIAQSGPSAASDGSTECCGYAFHRPPNRMDPPWAMTPTSW